MVTGLAPPPSDPVALPPARRPGSVRRTSTVLMSWPGGLGTDLLLQGRARDLLTPMGGTPEVLAESELTALTGRRARHQAHRSRPTRRGSGQAGGVPGRGEPAQVDRRRAARGGEAGTPLYLLLDDLAGATLISGFAIVPLGRGHSRDRRADQGRVARRASCSASARASAKVPLR